MNRKERSGNAAPQSSRKRLRYLILALAVISVAGLGALGGTQFSNPLNSPDPSGVLSTYSTSGGIDLSNPFFQSLGTNGRSCGSCHVASDGWSITPPHLRDRFAASRGLDPVFRPVDGANCPSADVSTVGAREDAYSLLLSKGLIRISVAVPGNAEFSVEQIRDPYACPETTTTQLAMYRRPLPSTNLDFLSAVMWDGRETVFGAIPGKSINLTQSLTNQGKDATLGHAQAANPPTAAQLEQIVAFETGLYTAQSRDHRAGSLTSDGALGGPVNLSTQNFYIGINDALGGDPTHTPFDSKAFTLYNAWTDPDDSRREESRESVARGQALFNTFLIRIRNVGGLNDALGLDTINGTCTTCHDSPNVGNHSFSVPLRIGTTDYPAVPALDISGLPVYRIKCGNGTVIDTTDPGRGLISGKCADLGKVKGPILRGLAGRAPYFHNGSATSLEKVVEFYDQRFILNLTVEQKHDLVAFLRTL
jgi:cytochrome c peroxidase